MGLLANLRSLPRNALLLLLAGMALRVALIAFHQRPLISDEKDYHRLAVSLSTTAEYANNGVPTAYRPIAYPAFVATVYGTLGEHPIIVKIVQAFIDVFTALLLYLIVREEYPGAQITALALWCFYLPAILYANLLITETIFTSLVVLCCYFVLKKRLETSASTFFVGIILGVLVLIKSGMALFVLAFIVLMRVSQIPLPRYRYILAGMVVVLAPWLVRNYITLGKPTLSTSGGINLLIGNNPNANGSYTLNFPEEIFTETSSEIEADESAYSYAVQYIVDHPVRFIVNGIKKTAHFFSSEGGLLVWSFHNNPEDFSERFAHKYASIPVIYTALVNMMYFAAIIIGLLGFLQAKKDLLWRFIASFAGCLLATHIVFYGGFRYHFPIVPFSMLYAAPILTTGREAFKRLTKAKKVFFIAITGGLASIWIVEFITVYTAR